MIYIPTLGSFKLGEYKLGEYFIATVDLNNTVIIVSADQNVANKDLINGVVLVRENYKSLTNAVNIYNNSTKDFANVVNINYSNIYDLTNSVFLAHDALLDFNNNINIVFDSYYEFENNAILAINNTLDLINNITIYQESINDFHNIVNITFGDIFDLTNNATLSYQCYQHLDNFVTIKNQKNRDFTNTINIAYLNNKDLNNNVEIRKYHEDFLNIVHLKTLGIQGILLYKDAQHTQLVDNDAYSFIYDFGELKEEENIFPFYIVNTRPLPLLNMWVGIEVNDPYKIYQQHMVFLSKNNINYTNQDISLGNIMPTAEGTQFYIKIVPSLGINNETNLKINFKIYNK